MSDGIKFLLNEETQLYRIHLGIPELDDPKHLHFEYSYERLMEDPRSRGEFKIVPDENDEPDGWEGDLINQL